MNDKFAMKLNLMDKFLYALHFPNKGKIEEVYKVLNILL